jgi:hypothetical protein
VRFWVDRDRDVPQLMMDVGHPSWSGVYRFDEEDDGGEPGPALGWDADTLVWLAEGLQEACLLGPPQPLYWPLCEQHGAGVHPRVRAGIPAWWCTAGAGWFDPAGGHMLAQIGGSKPL